MKLLTSRPLSVALAAMIAALCMGAQDAQAETLFQRLFGGPIKKKQQVETRQAPPAPRKQAAPARITGPSYYTYKTDALKPVDFAPLAAIGQSASLEQTMGATGFREAVSGLDGYQLIAEPDIGKAVVAYYSAHPEFVWVTGDAVNDRGREALRVLGEAGSHGLSPADYAVTVPSSTDDLAARKSGFIRFEMALSARLLRYVHDAQNGRIDPNRISGYHDLPAKPLDLNATLADLATAPDVRVSLEAHHPNNAQYRALRVELETLNASAENEIVVDPKLLLKPGETNPELAKLLHLIARDLDDEMGGEFGPTLATLSSSETYVPELVPVIEAVQEREGLKPDGVIGPRTVAKLAGSSKADRLDKVIIALEQLRWLPSELGSTRVFINQPAFTASYIENDADKLKMRVVVGKPSNQTSFFYDEIEQVDYNPYWGVPQSIIVNEMLPRLRSDPGYLDRAGYEVTNAQGKRVPSASVNWGAYGAKIPYGVRQSPSEANALGELKILFPNKHAIYMHDTPQKAFFARDDRALSHGCVRLADPRGMAAAVLGKPLDYVAEKLSQGHSSEKTRPIPVYVAYFTAWPNDAGTVEYFGDVYERDAHVKAAMQMTDAVRAPAS